MNEWRGNVRELRNTLEQLAVMAFAPGARTNGMITETDVESVLSQYTASLWNESLASEHYPIVQTKPREIQPTSELTLIYRALLELRSDIAQIKERLSPNGNITKALPDGIPINSDDLNIEKNEQQLITDALDRFGGDRSKAAAALGVSERTLYRKLKEIQ
jgi:DNA-binding NtrC family response regulator